MVRVRFAPSPTGNLHIGGARTALFNWLYARAKGGKFVLRIEDTDLVRSKKEFLDEILNSLKWLGLEWDELYHQSERFQIYRDYANQLLSKGLAYKDGEAIIFKVQPGKIQIQDLIRQEPIEFDTAVIKDQVLIKSDLSPTYNFACVIDDALMNITHIIRGDDHISNTPKQVILYQALGLPLPAFAHLPLILGTEGGRLSKRTGATAISDYRKMGYLAPALTNYLLLLGWSPGADQEIIALKEAAGKFDIKDANKTAAAFNLEKLNWINAQYIRGLPDDSLAELLRPLAEEKGCLGDNFDRNYFISVVKLFKERINVLNDFSDYSDFFFKEEIDLTPEAQKKLQAKDYSGEFKLLIERMDSLEAFNHPAIEQAFRGLVAELGIKTGELVHPVRAALTGKTVGPGLFELMEVLGKERIARRLNKFIKGGI
ncbi:MAG TPA: glutamate--tRNA ligase [Candidatus Omnitrophota bacterium]|nr:glutamate--tRNA ligase [Candidatus Omnitrophota bacterium]